MKGKDMVVHLRFPEGLNEILAPAADLHTGTADCTYTTHAYPKIDLNSLSELQKQYLEDARNIMEEMERRSLDNLYNIPMEVLPVLSPNEYNMLYRNEFVSPALSNVRPLYAPMPYESSPCKAMVHTAESNKDETLEWAVGAKYITWQDPMAVEIEESQLCSDEFDIEL